MPELPEVQTTLQGLNKLINYQITNIDIYSTKLRYNLPLNFSKLLKFNKFLKIFRIGKYIFINLESKHTLIIHLGMSGRLRIIKANKFIKKKHDHVALRIKDKILLYNDVRKFGFLKILNTKNIFNNKHVKNIGIDALDKKLNNDYFYQKIKNSSVPIKQILLNQKIISGIGNIYASEILFDAKISPFIRGKFIQKHELKKIISSIRKILQKAIFYGGSSLKDFSSADGTLGNFQNKFKVYDREGRTIKGNVIKRTVQYGRSTFYCPNIQKISKKRKIKNIDNLNE